MSRLFDIKYFILCCSCQYYSSIQDSTIHNSPRQEVEELNPILQKERTKVPDSHCRKEIESSIKVSYSTCNEVMESNLTSFEVLKSDLHSCKVLELVIDQSSSSCGEVWEPNLEKKM